MKILQSLLQNAKHIMKCVVIAKCRRAGWLETYKKTLKWKDEGFYARAMAELPRILFGRERGKVEIRKTGSDQMANV